MLLLRESGGLELCVFAGDTVLFGCGAPACWLHLCGPLEVCLRPGQRILCEEGAVACLGAGTLCVARGVIRCRLRVRTTVQIGAAPPLTARGALRIAERDGIASLLVVEGVVAAGATLHPRGSAIESVRGAPWQRVAWPRWTAQEHRDVMRWPTHIEAHGGVVQCAAWSGNERWLIARMLQHVRSFSPLTRTAVLALALERGSSGLRVAALQLLADAECCWLLQIITPLTLSAEAVVAEQALAAWHRGSPRGGMNPVEVPVDVAAWQSAWSAREEACARRRARPLEQPWRIAPCERLRAEEALERGDESGVVVEGDVDLPPDRSFTDPVVRALVARHAGLLAGASRRHAHLVPGLLGHRREAEELARVRGSQVLCDGIPRHWSSAGLTPRLSFAHWIPLGGELFP